MYCSIYHQSQQETYSGNCSLEDQAQIDILVHNMLKWNPEKTQTGLGVLGTMTSFEPEDKGQGRHILNHYFQIWIIHFKTI